MLPIWILDRWRLILEIAAAVILLIWIGALTIQTKSLKADLRECQVFKKETEALGRLAEAKAKQENANREGVTDRVEKTSKPRRAVLLKRLSDASPDSGKVPGPAPDKEGVAGAATERPTCPGYAALEARAALDAEALLTWQEWAREQGFPVR